MKIKQEKDSILFYNTTLDDVERIWINYFDMNNDYNKIKDKLIQQDKLLKTAIEVKSGIHILKQDPFEILISFIVSQNKQIPHIKKVIENISRQFGEKIQNEYEQEFYTFPSAKVLSNASEQSLKDCKAGFRVPYILDAANKVAKGEINIEVLKSKYTYEIKESIMSIKGVGNKISDCVLLYGFGRTEVFPTDVWIK